MTEVLSELAIFQTQIAARQSVHGGDCAATILRVCRSHEELRARLESAEAALRESLHILAVEDKGDHYCPIVGCGTPVWGEHVPACPFAALAAAGERSEG